MVLAYHLILSAYGFWLPDDERGSWSQFVRAYELARFGPATKTTTRRSVAHRRYDPIRRDAMLAALARKPVVFDGHQARAVARGLSDYAARSPVPIYACAVMPNHAHLVVGRSRLLIERVCEQLKGAATAQLNREGRHPFAGQSYRNGRLPTPWARKGWWVFLDRAADIRRAIRYVNANPVRTGLRPQRWLFVTAYEQQWAGTLRDTR
ncbi:MAG: transposase [Planctomycetes bacterium]|nr:transposase [Planctomycetota bacterium]